MQCLIESYNEEKGKNKRLKKYIAKRENDDAMFSDLDFEAYVPNFEESSSFHSKVGEGSSSSLNLKRTTTHKGIDSFVPAPPLVFHQPLMLNGRK